MYYKLSCPVPKEQRPIQEYMELVESNFFNWPILGEVLFRQKLIKIFLGFFIISLSLSNLFFNQNQLTIKFLLINSVITIILIWLIIIKLLLDWNYIKQRLYSSTVFYEESGWYDGRIWIKSKNILIQDRLILTYQVLPAIKILNNTFKLLSGFFIIFLFLIKFN